MKKVVLVDDSKFARKRVKELLENLGCEIVGEGADGIENYKKHSPNLIVTDLEMPNMDGLGMIKEIRKDDKTTKIIVISSIVNAQAVQELIKLQSTVLSKPVKDDELLQALKL